MLFKSIIMFLSICHILRKVFTIIVIFVQFFFYFRQFLFYYIQCSVAQYIEVHGCYIFVVYYMV